MLKLMLTLSFILTSSSITLACGDRNLSEFNPVGNGIANDSSAFQSAWDALALCGGGTLHVPSGNFRVTTGTLKNFMNPAMKIAIRGKGTSSQIRVDVGGLADAFVFQNADVVIEYLTFVGGGIQGAQTEDAKNVIHFSGGRGTVQHNLFIGIGSISPGASTVRFAHGAQGAVEHNQFLACRSHSAQSPWTGTVLGDSYGGLIARYNLFLDYGVLNGNYYSTNGQAGMAWIILLEPHNAEVFSTPQVVITDNRFDEGAFCAVVTTSSVQLQSMKLNRNKMNVGVGCGYSLTNIKYLEIDGGLAGLHNGGAQVDAIALNNVKYPTIRNFVITPGTNANRLSVDSGTIMLRLIDSKFAQIINNAQAWRIEDGSMITSFPAVKLVKKVF